MMHCDWGMRKSPLGVKYKGYFIIKTKHPTPFNPDREAYDIIDVMDNRKVRKKNISTLEVAKKFIDTMIKYGMWPDRSIVK